MIILPRQKNGVPQRQEIFSRNGKIGIAVASGFCDSNYLGRLFRKRYGTTPHRYRKLFRKHAD